MHNLEVAGIILFFALVFLLVLSPRLTRGAAGKSLVAERREALGAAEPDVRTDRQRYRANLRVAGAFTSGNSRIDVDALGCRRGSWCDEHGRRNARRGHQERRRFHHPKPPKPMTKPPLHGQLQLSTSGDEVVRSALPLVWHCVGVQARRSGPA
jgi:hypothetical protein